VDIEVIGNGSTVPPEDKNWFYHGDIIDFTGTPKNGWYFNSWIINTISSKPWACLLLTAYCLRQTAA